MYENKIIIIITIIITILFSLSVAFSFISQQELSNIFIIYQKENFDYVTFVTQQNYMVIWNVICKGEECQNMREREEILNNLSTKLSNRFVKNSIEIEKFEKRIKIFNLFSMITFFLGLILSVITIGYFLLPMRLINSINRSSSKFLFS